MQVGDPRGQRGQRRLIHLQHLQVREVFLPGLDHAAAFGLHCSIGYIAAGSGRFGFVLSLVTGLLPACVDGLGLGHLADTALYQGELFASNNRCLAQLIAGRVEGLLAECRQCGGREHRQRTASPRLGRAAGQCRRGEVLAGADERLFGLCLARAPFRERLLLALEASECLGIHSRRIGAVGCARFGVAFGLIQAIRVLHRRVGLQLLEPGAGGEQGGVHRLEAGLRLCLGLLRGLPGAAGLVEAAAGGVMAALCAAQGAGLSARVDRGVTLVALGELADGLRQCFVILQFAAVFLELVECVGDVGQQLGRQWRQRLGQRVGEFAFIGLSGQLWLAQLDQGIHQGRITHGAELEQALVDRAPVCGGGVEHLAVIVQCFLQAFAGEYAACRAGEP